MKILILNDSHDRSKNSVNRLGNMHEDMMLKLDETIELAKDCNFVIHLGDIWDSPNVTNNVIDDWIDRIEASKKNWYIVPGNHDESGGRWETSSSSALAHTFRRSTSINILDELSIKEDSGNKFYIKGYPYIYNFEKTLKEEGLHCEGEGDFKIACTHSFISIDPFHPEVLHTQAKDIETDYDVVLCSHFHHYFDKTIDGTRFLNLGAWGRLSITDHKHIPKVAILDTETKEIEIIELKSAKKGSEIFDLEKVKEIKASDKKIEDFIKSLESADFQSTNIKGIVEKLAKDNKVEREVVDLILEKLND